MAGKTSAEVAALLKKMEAKWKEDTTKAAGEGDFARLPDGKYIAQLVDAEIGQSQAGRNQVTFKHVILEGEQTGEFVYAYDSLEGEDSLYWLARRLSRMGVDPTSFKLSMLPKILAKLVEDKVTLKVQLKTKGEFQNCYVLNLLPDYDGSEETEEDEDEDEEEEAEEVEETDEEEDEEEEGEELEVGTQVTFQYKGKELEGEVVALTDDSKAKVKSGTKTYTLPAESLAVVHDEESEDEEEEDEEEAEEEEDDSEDSDEVELEVGMSVEFPWKGETLTGQVTELNEETGKVKVKAGTKVCSVAVENISVLE